MYGILGLIDGQGIGAIMLFFGLLLLAVPVRAITKRRMLFRPRRLLRPARTSVPGVYSGVALFDRNNRIPVHTRYPQVLAATY